MRVTIDFYADHGAFDKGECNENDGELLIHLTESFLLQDISRIDVNARLGCENWGCVFVLEVQDKEWCIIASNRPSDCPEANWTEEYALVGRISNGSRCGSQNLRPSWWKSKAIRNLQVRCVEQISVFESKYYRCYVGMSDFWIEGCPVDNGKSVHDNRLTFDDCRLVSVKRDLNDYVGRLRKLMRVLVVIQTWYRNLYDVRCARVQPKIICTIQHIEHIGEENESKESIHDRFTITRWSV